MPRGSPVLAYAQVELGSSLMGQFDWECDTGASTWEWEAAEPQVQYLLEVSHFTISLDTALPEFTLWAKVALPSAGKRRRQSQLELVLTASRSVSMEDWDWGFCAACQVELPNTDHLELPNTDQVELPNMEQVELPNME